MPTPYEGFYPESQKEVWGGPIGFTFLPDEKLAEIIARGTQTWTALSQEPPSGLHKWAKRIMVPLVGAGLTAGAALAITGASAAAGAATAAAGQPVTAGTTIAAQAAQGTVATAASGSGLSVSSVLGAAKSYVPKVAGVVAKVAKATGAKDVADVAGVIASSKDVTDTLTGLAVNEIQKRYGKLSPEGRQAVEEMITREQRRMAEEYRKKLAQARAEQAARTGGKQEIPTWAYAAVPLLLFAVVK